MAMPAFTSKGFSLWLTEAVDSAQNFLGMRL